MTDMPRAKALALVFCYTASLSRHLMLESWYMVRNIQAKPHIRSHQVSTLWLSAIDSFYLFCYATGNIISGSIEDNYSLKKMIGGGLIFSAFLYWAIAFVGYLEVNSPGLFLAFWVMQGLVQSPVHPGSVALLGKWFSPESRGKIMGFYCTSSSGGNALAAALVALMIAKGGTWELAMFLFSIVELLTGICFLFIVKEKPVEIEKEILLVSINEKVPSRKRSGIPFIQAVMIPNIINFAVAIACMKFMNYALSMWIPFYLHEQGKSAGTTGALTSLMELGSLAGTLTCGWLGDRFKSRPPIISLFIFFSFPALLALALMPRDSTLPYFFFIPFAGFCAGAPNFILGSAVPADIAQHQNLNQFEAMATIAGIIDGSGGLGAGLGMIIVGTLARRGWGFVFSFMLTTGCIAFSALYWISKREVLKYLARRRSWKAEVF